MTTRRITIFSNKGGAAKTVTSVALAYSLSQFDDITVILTDLDSNGNTAPSVGQPPAPTIFRYFNNGGIPVDETRTVISPTLHLVRGDATTAQITHALRYQTLASRWVALTDGYAFAIADTGGGTAPSVLREVAMDAADLVIVPMNLAAYDIDMVGPILDAYQDKQIWLLPSAVNLRLSVQKALMASVQSMWPTHMRYLPNGEPLTIPDRTAVNEAGVMRQPVTQYSPTDDASVAYKHLALQVKDHFDGN